MDGMEPRRPTLTRQERFRRHASRRMWGRACRPLHVGRVFGPTPAGGLDMGPGMPGPYTSGAISGVTRHENDDAMRGARCILVRSTPLLYAVSAAPSDLAPPGTLRIRRAANLLHHHHHTPSRTTARQACWQQGCPLGIWACHRPVLARHSQALSGRMARCVRDHAGTLAWPDWPGAWFTCNSGHYRWLLQSRRVPRRESSTRYTRQHHVAARIS